MALEKIEVTGGRPLRGEIEVFGAKNAALPIMAASLLTSEPCRIHNLPYLHDVETMETILQSMGARTGRMEREMQIEVPRIQSAEAPYEFVRKMRASVLLLGPLVAREGKARVSLPGGCAIGVRPIEQHLKALEALGAEIKLADGYVEARGKKLRGARVKFDIVTVTGTANAMMAAALAEGESTFENCAREPEVVQLAEVLRKMGARVEGEGTPTIHVGGKNALNGFDEKLIPDRIAAGTYLAAGLLTEGTLLVKGADPTHLGAVLQVLTALGGTLQVLPEGIRISGHRPFAPIDLVTAPYPGFPTDMQAQVMVLACLAEGRSRIMETIFENRFMHVAELIRMGAKLEIDGSTVTIDGVTHLTGAPVMATDLRASASLVLAGLAAQGKTEVLRIYHLDRGYENMERNLTSVGAEIRRLKA